MTGADRHRQALETVAQAPRPAPPWPADDGIPWSDPAFSRRVLDVHLDASTHMASRSPDVIARHLDWLEEEMSTLPGGEIPRRVLEVGCGPGLYVHELARRGHRATGFDIAPAGLAWARKTATDEGLDCTILEADLDDLPDDFAATVGPVDAVTFWFGDFHGFPPATTRKFMTRLADCLAPGGLFVLEYQPADHYEHTDSSQWHVADKSVFCPRPHIWLEEFFWHAAEKVEVHVHWIIETDSGSLSRYVQCHQAWTDDELSTLLADAGLGRPAYHDPITGIDAQFEFPVLVARKDAMNPNGSAG